MTGPLSLPSIAVLVTALGAVGVDRRAVRAAAAVLHADGARRAACGGDGCAAERAREHDGCHDDRSWRTRFTGPPLPYVGCEITDTPVKLAGSEHGVSGRRWPGREGPFGPANRWLPGQSLHMADEQGPITVLSDDGVGIG